MRSRLPLKSMTGLILLYHLLAAGAAAAIGAQPSLSTAFTGFDDGHITGFMLLTYSAMPGGRIEWTRLWATLDE